MSLLTKCEPQTLSNLLDDVFADLRFRPRALSNQYPPVEVREEKESFLLTAEVSGLAKEDLAIEVKNGVLTLSGEKKLTNSEDKEGYFYSERSYGKFARSFNIGENVSSEEVEASYKDGLLFVRLKKNKPTEAKRVEIK